MHMAFIPSETSKLIARTTNESLYGGPNWACFRGNKRNVVDDLTAVKKIIREPKCWDLLYDNLYMTLINMMDIWYTLLYTILGTVMDNEVWKVENHLEILLDSLLIEPIVTWEYVPQRIAEGLSNEIVPEAEVDSHRTVRIHQKVIQVLAKYIKQKPDVWEVSINEETFNPYGTDVRSDSISAFSFFSLGNKEIEPSLDISTYCEISGCSKLKYKHLYLVMTALYQLAVGYTTVEYRDDDLIVLLTVLAHMGWIKGSSLIEQLPILILQTKAKPEEVKEEHANYWDGISILGLLTEVDNNGSISLDIDTFIEVGDEPNVSDLGPANPISQPWSTSVILEEWIRNIRLGTHGFQIEPRTYALVRGSIPLMYRTVSERSKQIRRELSKKRTVISDQLDRSPSKLARIGDDHVSIISSVKRPTVLEEVVIPPPPTYTGTFDHLSTPVHGINLFVCFLESRC